ncbi:VC0807 family protein [Paludibacterium yongneupense]|uniref:VC0807 family protein n=1 Tax=Paludibacterium yongneupense TaxID=400061 RepID=UPI0003FE7FF7|nr:VC0807 family protein [Paludibacterium yongneupense]
MKRLRRTVPLAGEIAINFVLPWLAYRLTVTGFGESRALLASTVPPLLWSGVELARHRRIDALSVMVLAGIVLSLLVLALGGDPRAILLRESLISGLIGAAFVLSCLAPRPLIYYLARAGVRRTPGQAEEQFEALYRHRPGFARSLRLMTLVWGAGLVAETALKAILVGRLPADRFLLLAPWIGYAIYGALLGWTLLYRRRLAAG